MPFLNYLERWCCHRGFPRVIRLIKVVLSLSVLVPAPIMLCSAKEAGGVVRLEGQAGGYSKDYQLGNRGTDALVFNRGYKPSELLSPAKDWASGEVHVSEARAALKTESGSAAADGHARLKVEDANDGRKFNNAVEPEGGELGGGIGLPLRNQASLKLEHSHFNRLVRDCCRLKCPPSLACRLDLKQQPLKDDLPGFVMKAAGVVPLPQVAILPPFLEWGPQSIFTPSTSSLTIVNTCNSTELKVFQPFSTDLQFYASGFEESVVSPGEKIAVPIVFLPRALGPADAMIIVQTSAGGFLVHAQGKGVGSPYQVVSLQGLRMASGEVLRSTITLYNPHKEALNVTNVYVQLSRVEDSSFQSSSSSGTYSSPGSITSATATGDHHHHPCQQGDDLLASSPCKGRPLRADEVDLEFFHGGVIARQRSPVEGGMHKEQNQLKIDAKTREPIMDLELEAKGVGRYTGFLHVKLQVRAAVEGQTEGSPPTFGELLMVPVELQVVDGGDAGDGQMKGADHAAGAFGAGAQEVVSAVDVLDFGIFTDQQQTSKMDVVLYNSGSETVAVEDIRPLLDDDNIVHIEYERGLVIPSQSETEVAVVTYMGKEEAVPMDRLFECDSQEFLRDRILIVRTNSSVSPKVEVRYRALVFHGSSLDCGDPAAQGSVGFVPKMSSEGSVMGGGSAMLMPDGGASGQQRVHFANDRTIPLHLFQVLKGQALSTGIIADLSPPRRDDEFCCYQSSPGHLTVAAAGQYSILLSSEMLFPLVQTGKEELRSVNIANPSEEPLLVQALVSSRAEATGQSCQVDDGQSLDVSAPCCKVPGDNQVVAAHDDFQIDASNVFTFANGAVVEALIEPHGNAALGPIVFRPPERCLWTGLLSIWNNLTEVEWIPLWGAGGSGSLTFLDGDYPINQVQLNFNLTKAAAVDAGAVEEDAKVDLQSEKGKSAMCSQRVSREFLAKNTGDVHLHVAGVEFHGGGCSAHGFVVNSCREEFSLAPGQSAELSVSFQPKLSTGIFQRDLQLITSAGVVQLPILAILADYNALCSVVGDSTKLYKALLWVSSVALLVVLTVFFRMLANEMTLPDTQAPTSGIKSNTLARGGHHVTPVRLSSQSLISSKSSGNASVAMAAGRGAKGGIQSEPDLQFKAGGNGPGASSVSTSSGASSGQGKLKDSSTKAAQMRVSKVMGVSDTCTSTIQSSAVSASDPAPAPAPAPAIAKNVPEKEAEVPPSSPSLPALRVKIPNSAACSAQKSTLGSPMREASSAASPAAQFRVAAASSIDKMTNIGGKGEGRSHAAKIVPEPPTDGHLSAGQVVVKQSSSPLVRSAVSNNSSTSNLSAEASISDDVGKSQQSSPRTPSRSVNPKVRSPKNSSHFLQTSKPASSQSPKDAQAQGHQSGAAYEKEKPGRRKKRRNNVGAVRHGSVSKGRSGSPSPSSSPASPATPAACSSRPVSPLLQSLDTHQQPTTPGSSSSSCADGHCSGGQKDHSKARNVPKVMMAPLSKLDVAEQFSCPSATSAAKNDMTTPLTASPIMYRGDSLSVDDASAALREMAHANSVDLSWATLAARGSRPSVEKGSDSTSIVGKRGNAPKDWLSAARKGSGGSDTVAVGGEGERLAVRNWPGNRKGSNFKSNVGSPTLTPSFTFPRRQGYERGPGLGDGIVEGSDYGRGIIMPAGNPQPVVPISTMPPASRAPGANLASKPFVTKTRAGDNRGDWAPRSSEDSEEYRSRNSWGRKYDYSPSRRSELGSEENNGVYDIWDDHFGEFSRCSSNIVGSITPHEGPQRTLHGGAAVQSLAVLHSSPSFFSSFPVPSVPSLDDGAALMSSASALPGINNTLEGFSVFSQAPDVEALCLPSSLFNSPKTTPTPSSSKPLHVELKSSVSNGINLGPGKNVVKYNGFGGVERGGNHYLSSSPRKPRGPYSPPLCPSSHGGTSLASLATSESSGSTTNDPSFWSGLNPNQQQGSSAR